MTKSITGAMYAEALVAVAILAIALVPATNAIHAALQSSNHFATATNDYFLLRGRLDELLAEPFPALDTAAAAAGSAAVPTSYSDPVGPDRRLVYLSRYDADNADADGDPFTGTEADLLWIRVAIEGTNRGFETLVAR